MTGQTGSDGLSSDDLLAEAKRELADDSGPPPAGADDVVEMTAEEIAAELAGDSGTEVEPAIRPHSVPPAPAGTLPGPGTAPPADPDSFDPPVPTSEPGLIARLWRRRWVLVVAFVVVGLVGSIFDTSESVADLSPGDCFDDPGEAAEVSEVDLIDCDDAHDLEVIGSVALDGDAYPGDFAAGEKALFGCLDHFAAYIGEPYETSILYILPLTPTEASWKSGDREAHCVVYEPVPGSDGFEILRRTGSLRGSGI